MKQDMPAQIDVTEGMVRAALDCWQKRGLSDSLDYDPKSEEFAEIFRAMYLVSLKSQSQQAVASTRSRARSEITPEAIQAGLAAYYDFTDDERLEQGRRVVAAVLWSAQNAAGAAEDDSVTEIEVTPAMIKAGVNAYYGKLGDDGTAEWMVRDAVAAIYGAMRLKTRPKPREDSGKRKQSPAKDKPKKEKPAK